MASGSPDSGAGKGVGISKTSTPTPAEIKKELVNFVSAATGFNTKYGSTGLARSALFLLRTVPATRDAVLEYLCCIFDDAVANHVRNLDPPEGATTSTSSNSSSGQQGYNADYSVIQNVQEVLSNFITASPTAWAPIVSTWSLDLLGQLSNKYADRRGVPHTSSLNEVLQLWMTCRPTRVLINLTTQCISTLISSNPDMCIDALLETSVQHSPHFDWVVAHIGSCFPTTIITRVLACGLKDFCSHNSGNPQTEQQTLLLQDKKVPKMASVVGILGHLAGQHSVDIRNALLALFCESFADQPTAQQLATVPFLLQLATMSPMLRNVVTTYFIKSLTPNILNKLCWQIPMWRQKSAQNVDELANIVVHLILQSLEGGAQVIHFLLQTATPGTKPSNLLPLVPNACGQILDILLLEIQRLVNIRHNCGQADIPLLGALRHDVDSLCQHLLDNSEKKTQWALRLVAFLAVQGGQQVATGVVSYILMNSDNPGQLMVLPELLSVVEPCIPNLLQVTVTQILTESKISKIKSYNAVIKNILHMVRWEQDSMFTHSGVESGFHFYFTSACIQNISLVVHQMANSSVDVLSDIIELLAIIPFPAAMSMSLLSVFCSEIVRYFFAIVSQVHVSERVKYLSKCQRVVAKLCRHASAQNVIIRALVEGVILTSFARNFGGIKANTVVDDLESEKVSLLRENQKHAFNVTLPQSHATIFHAGVIGRGVKSTIPETPFPRDEVLQNTQLLLDMMKWVCMPDVSISPTEGMTTLSLLLVELVSPDVMFNGLPWPDEDFTKVTVERDLQIKRMFEDYPVLWELLSAVASTRPSLCCCSVLLRALTAVTISFWSSCQERMAADSPKQLEVSRRLVEIMSAGLLLPPPLSMMGEIFCYLTPYEVYILMCDIWRYMKENVPTPAAFTTANAKGQVWKDFGGKCDKKFTSRLHCVLQNNINKLGHLYTRFFNHVASNNNEM